LNLTKPAPSSTTMGQTERGLFMNKKHFTALIVGSGLAIAAGSAFAGAAAVGDGAGDGAGCDKAGGKARGASAHFSQIDANKDGKVSLAELSASREAWLTKVDTNKDGVATQAEIDAAFQATRAEHVQKRFEREDANKDGRLTREETRMPSARFERADANKDGALTLAELTAANKNAGAEGHAGRAGKGARFDQNGDGKVVREELRAAAAAQFARLDTNKDGSLTSDEFRMAGRGHGQHRHGADGHKKGDEPSAPVGS
jgi:Ca2+-binding EF-hand superfamily protein